MIYHLILAYTSYMNASRWFRFQPTVDLVVVGISWLLVVSSLYIATNVITAQNGILYFLFYAIVGATLFGIGVPLFWIVVKKRLSLEALGITSKKLWTSLILQLLFTVGLYYSAFTSLNLPEFGSLLPLVALALSIGFFEAVFWRGWVQLRFEEAFGIVPAIILASAVYALYHIGYGMPFEEIRLLFVVGLMYATTFRLTKNIFILYPLFQPLGQLLTLVKDKLDLPTIAALGFFEVLIVMAAMIVLVQKFSMKLQKLVRMHTFLLHTRSHNSL